MELNRALSSFEIKSFENDQRTFEGIASTPTSDHMGDIVEPMGAKYTLPIPMLWQHGKGDNKDPIGWVTDVRVAADGIFVKGKFAKVDAPPSLKEDLDRAWALVKSKLVSGLSIGFKPLESQPIKGSGGERFTSWSWLELSPVAIGANSDALILSVKSADSTVRAALGTRTGVVRLDSTVNLPGVSGRTGNMKMGKPIAEQIVNFESKHAANEARMTAIMEKVGDEGRTLDDTEREEYKGLETEGKSIVEHIALLKAHEQRLVSKATPITATATNDPEKASATRGGSVVSVKSNTPKGTAFSRWVMAIVNSRGDLDRAADAARKHWPDMPEIELTLRAAVEAGSSTGATWAAPLIPAAQRMQEEFIELLRPALIIGRIPGLRRVPPNISVPAQTGGGTFGWVGEGKAKPVSAMAFDSVTLRWAKAAGICVLTKELIRYSSPSAEQIVRDSMVKDITAFLDVQFIDPTVAEVTASGVQVSPASITNGVTPTAASGTTAAAFRTDMKALFATFLTVNDNPSDAVVLMSATVALNLSLLINTLGQPEFPNIGMQGGSILGLPVIVSQAVGARIIILKASDILLADDGPIEIDASGEASIVCDSAPQNSPMTTELVSMYQQNKIAIRVEKWITWRKARTTSVAYISSAAYSG